jgi:hypothetical protein
VFDLPYIATHPLLAWIVRRCAELRKQASALPEASAERNPIEKRISQLEEYGLPRPNATEQQATSIIGTGRVVAVRSSLRRRFKDKRRGRPEEYTIQTRAALEDKLAEPQLTWKVLAKDYKFESVEVLKHSVRRLKAILRREGIPLPTPSAYQAARRQFEESSQTFFHGRGEE